MEEDIPLEAIKPMKGSSFRLAGALLLTAALSLSSVLSANADVRAKVKEATAGFRDISMTCKVVRANHAELQKIGKDFPKTYEIKTSTIHFKAPDKIRIEGNVGLFKMAMVINGDIKAYMIPSIHYVHRENIKGQPHKRQNELDMGILTSSLWEDYIVVSVEPEKETYKIVFVRTNARKKKIVLWADQSTLKLLKVEKFDDNGSLKSQYKYSEHKDVNGIWVPTRIEIFNQEGKLAAETSYENIKVNAGIPDSEFKL